MIFIKFPLRPTLGIIVISLIFDYGNIHGYSPDKIDRKAQNPGFPGGIGALLKEYFCKKFAGAAKILQKKTFKNGTLRIFTVLSRFRIPAEKYIY